MGIGFVFLVYLVVLAVVAVPAVFIGAVIGYFIGRRLGNKRRRRFVITGGLVPIFGAAYVVFCIVVMAMVGLATGRDVGFGDGFELPLNNHYHWSAIDVTDSATIYDVTDKSATDGDGNFHVEPDNRNAFSGVIRLQESGDWLAGELSPDHWFLFNTRTHQRVDAESEGELKDAAAKEGIALQLQSSSEFYLTHRLNRLDYVVVALLLIPPLAALVVLWRRASEILETARDRY